MNKADQLIDRAADRLRELSREMAARGDAIGERLAPELAEDAAFLRKLKPSLIAARVRGQAPTDQAPEKPPVAPSGPQVRRAAGGAEVNPLVVVGAAFALGIVLAKLIDWRSHAHPRD